jgi:hypothetical protein
MQSVDRDESGHQDSGHESHDKKHRLDFERFSSLPREMFSFFSRLTD